MAYNIYHPLTGKAFWLVSEYAEDNPYHGPKRPNPTNRKYLVVHGTEGNTAGDLAVLRGKTASKVSVKYLIADPQDGNYRKDGKLIIWRLLPHDVIGWSVGSTNGEFGYVENSNSDSIEISNRGYGHGDFWEEEQVQAVEALIAFEERRLNQNATTFGHREIAPDRKSDPNKMFPLERVKAFTRKLSKGKYPATVTKNGLLLRESNTVTATVIVKMPLGATVGVLIKGKWRSKVEYRGFVGYCRTAYLKF